MTSDLPVSPTTKRDHQEYLAVCRAWEGACEDATPFDEWGDQIARQMDQRERAAAAGDRR